MHSVNFKTKKLMQLFMPKLVIFRVTLHTFLKYLKFQRFTSACLETKLKLFEIITQLSKSKLAVFRIILRAFSQVCLKFRNHRYIHFCNLKTKLKVFETLTQLFMSKTIILRNDAASFLV